jgi:hypothetical protein
VVAGILGVHLTLWRSLCSCSETLSGLIACCPGTC